MSRPRVFFLFAVALALLAGCDELDKNGRLENGEFQYSCVGPGDAACDGTDAIFGFDLDRDLLPIAVGGHFRLGFDSDFDAATANELSAVTPEWVHVEGDDFVFQRAATVDFLARDDGDEVIDFVDFSALDVDGLGIFSRGGPVSTITLRDFERLIIAAAPLNGSQVLGGGFDYQWSVSGSGLDLSEDPQSEPDSGDNVVEIRGNSSGSTAVVTATMGSRSASVTVVIGDGGTSSSSASSTATGGGGGFGGSGSGGSGGFGGGGFGGGGFGGAGGLGGAGGG